MKRLVQGSVVQIPLLHGLGFAYAKYIDLTKIDYQASFPDLLKVFNFKSRKPINRIEELKEEGYLVSPLLVAGLRPTLKEGQWQIVGKTNLKDQDKKLPDFKEGNSSDPDIKEGKWYLIKECKRINRVDVSSNEVQYLQPFLGEGTGNIEIRLTMYFLLKEGKKVEEVFDMEDINVQRKYQQVLDSPYLPQG